MPALKNPRQERFVQELVKGRTHNEAYKLAGYTPHKGHGARLARQPAVTQRYQELAGAVAREAEVTAAQVINEIATIAFANMADYVTADGDGVPQLDMAKLTRAQSAAVVEIAPNAHRVRFKLGGKLDALIALGRMLGLFREQIEVESKAGEPAPELDAFETAKRIAFALNSAIVKAHQEGRDATPLYPAKPLDGSDDTRPWTESGQLPWR
jgi:phage terminase small subunit